MPDAKKQIKILLAEMALDMDEPYPTTNLTTELPKKL